MIALEQALESSIRSARVLRKAQEDYDRLMRNYGAAVEINKPLPEATFWRITETFRTLILQALVTKRPEPVHWAADEMFRLATYNNAANWWETKLKMYTPSFFETLNYAFTYSQYRRECYRLFDDIKQVSENCGRGDDAFGDLVDGLPMLGHTFYKRMMAKKFYDYPHFVKITRKTVAGFVTDLGDDYKNVADELTKKFSRLILEGENYFGMTLEDAAKEWFPRFYKETEEVAEEVDA